MIKEIPIGEVKWLIDRVRENNPYPLDIFVGETQEGKIGRHCHSVWNNALDTLIKELKELKEAYEDISTKLTENKENVNKENNTYENVNSYPHLEDRYGAGRMKKAPISTEKKSKLFPSRYVGGMLTDGQGGYYPNDSISTVQDLHEVRLKLMKEAKEKGMDYEDYVKWKDTSSTENEIRCQDCGDILEIEDEEDIKRDDLRCPECYAKNTIDLEELTEKALSEEDWGKVEKRLKEGAIPKIGILDNSPQTKTSKSVTPQQEETAVANLFSEPLKKDKVGDIHSQNNKRLKDKQKGTDGGNNGRTK